MTQIDTTCEHTKIRLIAAAIGHQQCTRTAANLIPLPSTDRVIAIGTRGEVARLLAGSATRQTTGDLPPLPLDLDSSPSRMSIQIKAGELAELIRRWGHAVYASAQAAPEDVRTDAARDVLAERRRQVSVEGYTPEDDDGYRAAELPRAAAAYILNGGADELPAIWPWARSYWKPRDARANYVRAAALLLAEIERIDRAEKGGAA